MAIIPISGTIWEMCYIYVLLTNMFTATLILIAAAIVAKYRPGKSFLGFRGYFSFCPDLKATNMPRYVQKIITPRWYFWYLAGFLVYTATGLIIWESITLGLLFIIVSLIFLAYQLLATTVRNSWN